MVYQTGPSIFTKRTLLPRGRPFWSWKIWSAMGGALWRTIWGYDMIWGFPQIGDPIKMDDFLGYPHFRKPPYELDKLQRPHMTSLHWKHGWKSGESYRTLGPGSVAGDLNRRWVAQLFQVDYCNWIIRRLWQMQLSWSFQWTSNGYIVIICNYSNS